MKEVKNGIRGAIEEALKSKISPQVIDKMFEEALRPGKDHGPLKKIEEIEPGVMYLEHEDGHGMFMGKKEFEAIKNLTDPNQKSIPGQDQ